MVLAFLLKRGLNHSIGKAKGPTHKNAITRLEVLKYHLTSDFLSNISIGQPLDYSINTCSGPDNTGHYGHPAMSSQNNNPPAAPP